MKNSIYNTSRNAHFVAKNCGHYSGKEISVGIEENDYFVNGGILHQTRYAFFVGIRRIGDVSITEDEKDHLTIRDYGYGKTLLNQFQIVTK